MTRRGRTAEGADTTSAPAALAALLEANDIHRALAVVAHPDDESFGLGALLSTLIDHDVEVEVLCFTHGEASTLGEGDGELGALRAKELRDAADHLGLAAVTLLDYLDGALHEVAADRLAAEVEQHLGLVDLLVVFEPGGVTGHPDHRAASLAAVRAATRHGLPMLDWGLSSLVTEVLNAEFGAGFTTFEEDSVLLSLSVDRSRQARAIACHRSQSVGNAVLARRLALQGDNEVARWHPPSRELESSR